MSASRCLKLLLLVSMIPLALRAASLLAGGHAAPAPSSSSRPSSWDRSRPAVTTSTAAAATAAATSAPRVVSVHARQARRRRRAQSAPDAARQPRQPDGGAGDWFEDDKRLAPTGSNPLHNLR